MITLGSAIRCQPVSNRVENVFYMTKYVLIFAFCLVFASFAEAAKNPSVSLKKNTNMAFGDVASSVDGAGTAVINSNSNSKYVTGSIIDFGGTVTRAKFTISKGTASGYVTITLPTSLTITKSGVTLTVDNLTSDVGTTAQLDGSGGLVFYVSGRLNVPASQSEKSGMTGDMTVLVEDNTTSTNDNASATVSGSVAAPISISATSVLSFGTISPGSTSGTIAVDTGGTSTAINVTEMAGSSVSEGVFTVTGDGGAAFSITLPVSATLSGGGYSMTVDNFQHDAGASPTIAGGGSRDVSIGATLNVGADQANGDYSGVYTIDVNYN